MSFPEAGRSADELLLELDAGRTDDADWRGGRAFSLVYNPADDAHEHFLELVGQRYLHENALNPAAFPSLRRMEREVVAAAADLLNADDPTAGSMSSGGTESIFLAVHVAREHARARGVERPTIVVPHTAHPAFNKACHYLDVAEVRIPVGADLRVDVGAVAAAIDSATAMLVGSAPCYPYGVVDPITELAALASDAGILCHVDACLGGWILPFWEELGEAVAPWDFRVPGVTSISADIHKYGYTFKGASVILHRDRSELKRQYFMFDDWPGGQYGSATTAGTRPAAPIAGAWAAIQHLGHDGYLAKTELVRDTTRVLQTGITSIEGLTISGEPVASVFELASESVDLATVAASMAEGGWLIDRQQGGLHLMVMPGHAATAERFLDDLAASVRRAGAGETAPEPAGPATYAS